MGKRILVLGGYGTFGRRISRAIAAIPSAECIVGGRHPQRATPVTGENITTITVNIHDPASLRLALEGMFAVVNTVGPFQTGDYTVAEACAIRGIHYVDLADARAHVENITRLNRRAEQRQCLIVSGASSVPAVSAALVDMLAPEFDRISEIHTCISPGNRNPHGLASVRAILSYTGNPIRLKEKGRWRYAYGWSEAEKVKFPRPVGKRRVYLCDVPDLDLFPARYGAQTVTFRAGLELNLFNYGLAMLGRMRRRGLTKNLSAWAPALSAASNLFRGSGGAAGGMRVRVLGRKDDREAEHTVFLMARDANGPAIPCSPSVALIRRWIERGVAAPGAVPCVGLLTWDDIKAELVNYDITLVRV
ncbi:MAG: saccharopine dehydrogenase family protein [Sulfuricaulis sp.]